MALAITAGAAVAGVTLSSHSAPLCDQETATDGPTVTYGAGAPGCQPNTVTYPGCRDEDGPGPCYWDANTAGLANGGYSFRIDCHQYTHYATPEIQAEMAYVNEPPHAYPDTC